MSWDFRPGVRVVCVDEDAEFSVQTSFILPKRGTVYTVREVTFCPIAKQMGLRFLEIVNPQRVWGVVDEFGSSEVAFRAKYFRPLSETRLDVFRSILTNAPRQKELS